MSGDSTTFLNISTPTMQNIEPKKNRFGSCRLITVETIETTTTLVEKIGTIITVKEFEGKGANIKTTVAKKATKYPLNRKSKFIRLKILQRGAIKNAHNMGNGAQSVTLFVTKSLCHHPIKLDKCFRQIKKKASRNISFLLSRSLLYKYPNPIIDPIERATNNKSKKAATTTTTPLSRFYNQK